MPRTADDPGAPPCRAACSASLACLQRLLDVLDGYCTQHGVGPEVRHDLRLIVEEACVNIVHYGYPPGRGGPIRLQVQARLGGAQPRVEVVIEDEGVAFDPFSLPEPARAVPLDARPAGGFGLTLIRHLSDGLQHARSPQGCNTLTVTKFLRPAGRADSNHAETP